MFRSAFRPLSSFPCPRSARSVRLLHRVTTDFIAHDARGDLVTRKVPVIVGDSGETYMLIEQEVGCALRAASPFISASAASAEYRYKLTFFPRFSTLWIWYVVSVRESYSAQPYQFIFIARINELSPSLCLKPNSAIDRVEYKPCNFVHWRKDAPSTSRWNTRCNICGERKRHWTEPGKRTRPAEGYVISKLVSPTAMSGIV
ncbi:uncharacterized protein N7515_008183 [Penicillium bovifimosum]|uniref:Uncharacterized protein n=1 Tax=Penicillium bovifimosum TaxID=126998 RepID=A0A9W9KXL2_9EURO|nr:uncharacterized protein N7515_008183 [Penicillium bovifimosum]KAJ5124358.1 hypothetical protein N7515_008183 [Penicillium bovifimosum]